MTRVPFRRSQHVKAPKESLPPASGRRIMEPVKSYPENGGIDPKFGDALSIDDLLAETETETTP